MTDRPSSDVDPFSDKAIQTPNPFWKDLRDIASAVWLTRYDMWAVARYADVKTVLGNWEVFTTAHGVAVDDKVNVATSGPGRANSLTSDPLLHDEIRNDTGKPFRPRGLREIEEQLSANDRVIVLYGSANRDEQRYDDPDRFGITRNNRDQQAFGYGLHTCGMHLARLEMTALLEAVLDKIVYFETDTPTIAMNNTLQGLDAMLMRVFAA